MFFISWSLRIWKLSFDLLTGSNTQNALLGSSCFFWFHWHSSTTSQALSFSLSVFPRYYLFLSLIFFFFDSQWSHRREHREIEGGGVRWPRWQEVSQRYRCLWYWYSLYPFWVFLILLFSIQFMHRNEPSLELIEYEERKLGCCFPLLL